MPPPDRLTELAVRLALTPTMSAPHAFHIPANGPANHPG
jgi:hypothetical protein